MYCNPRLSSELPSTCVEPAISPLAQQKQAPTQNGDEAAFRMGLVKLMPVLNTFSRTLCRDRELAKDLVQETLCKAWQARASFRPGTNLKAWLFTIFRNLMYSHHRRA
jgi:RNA polymerase sigma-70 factor (ECF subfamily)